MIVSLESLLLNEKTMTKIEVKKDSSRLADHNEMIIITNNPFKNSWFIVLFYKIETLFMIILSTISKIGEIIFV